ncbi:MAG: hypothetical protein ACK2VD_22590 [Anaerolineae bacterium]|jgi:hypothetical protein
MRASLAPGKFKEQWNAWVVGSAALEPEAGLLRFVNVDTTRKRAAVAQIDDYEGLPRRRHLWRPPLTMRVRARFSHPAGELSGTAGFGFWNDPFLMTGLRTPALPRALWFFYASSPSNMKLALDTPGHGWKAATLDAGRPAALLWAPLVPLLVPLMNVPRLYRAIWPPIQRALCVCESAIETDMTGWHTYLIEWKEEGVRFEVDGQAVAVCSTSPRGPLGFVMWLDNQSLVVTPWGRLHYRWLEAPGRQWMEVSDLSIVSS